MSNVNLDLVLNLLSDYVQIEQLPLEKYSDELTKYELSRIVPLFVPKKLTKGCLTNKKIHKLINLLLKHHITIKSLNLSNCIVTLDDIIKLLKLSKLTGLNLHNTLNSLEDKEEKYFNDFFNYVSEMKLELLDISNNHKIYNNINSISNMKSLKILSIENMTKNNELNIDFSKLTNLVELDISDNIITVEQLQQISNLKKLYLFYCDDIEYLDLANENSRNGNVRVSYFTILVDTIVKLQNLRYLKMSNYEVPYMTSLLIDIDVRNRAVYNFLRIKSEETLIHARRAMPKVIKWW